MDHYWFCVLLSLPKATVSVSPVSQVYSGETVTLQCEISDYTDWKYYWYFNNKQQRPGLPSTTITTLSDQDGQYQCQGTRTGRPKSSQRSGSLQITVTANHPKATLSSDQKDVLTGDSVTLTCTVESSGWRFYWYRHRQDSEPVETTSGSSYTLNLVNVSDGGQYRCRAGRGDPVYYTQYSEPVYIQITERPVAVLTLQPNWTQIFRGEGVKGNKISKTSDAVQLTVSNQPKVVLSISPQWLNPGDSVTLICEVKEPSTGWRFSWYKTVPYRTGLPSLLYKSYSVEPLSGYETTEESYTLSPAGPTDTGGYVCRAGRGAPVYYTDYSEPQYLWSGVSDLQSSVSLSPNRTQHFTLKSLYLSCDQKGNSTGWRLMRYTETGVKSGCSSNWRSITGSTCNITSTSTGDSGVYWCESGSGQSSNAVNITVSGDDVILESPAHPVTEGNSVTLHCIYRYQPQTNTKVDFYKDGVLIRNGTTGEITIPTVSKSDEGFYKCKSDQRESPESWMTVRSPRFSTSVLVGVGVSLVAAVLLTLFLVLLCQYKNNNGPCFNKKCKPIHNQSTNQDPQQDQGPTQVQSPDAGYTDNDNIYHMINHIGNNDKDCAGVSVAIGSGDVTYAQIQLKKLDKKRKGKPADPNEYSVYSELKIVEATGDVTYAQIQPKKLDKKRKGKPADPNSVYSELKIVEATASSGPVDVTYAEINLKNKIKPQKKKSS
ncbi:hypothetical protein DPEC_G00099030 [Dallia pectoralis]|uniref:Uncharacterized protein n=1 Tax=Dallia pectoralis TaxID=75939 RepID=A0ACC2GWL6_DALPE|nr:hypothetical protein DPEC_G00099030 [Dallia pectoralis]